MSKRRILSVELNLPFADEVEYERFNSDVSALDWDIVIFWPDASQFLNRTIENYQGKPLLSEAASFEFRERCQHWKRELGTAVEAGKTVVVFLDELQEVYVDTGNREYSGTGRNRHTTRVVELYSNYKAIPALLGVVKARGKRMRLAKGADLFRSYWKEFADLSEYQVRFTKTLKQPLLITSEGNHVVGCIYQSSNGGNLICLPALNLTDDDLWKKKPGTESDWVWSKRAREIAATLIGEVMALDAALRAGQDVTPPPAWTESPEFTLPRETDLKAHLLRTETAIDHLQQEKQELQSLLATEVELKTLLYGTGKRLESAILRALQLLGFEARSYRDSQSEFDAVFESPEGRLLGEAEGKDSKAVNIDKLRQLEMNIQEDFARETVSTPAKGVLFGNAFRLTAPAERGDYFTEKAYSAAKRSGYALVRTPDLYNIARYLTLGPDFEFARRCREAFFAAEGEVVCFPSPPASEEITSNVSESDV
jgi:hypothetical protein